MGPNSHAPLFVLSGCAGHIPRAWPFARPHMLKDHSRRNAHRFGDESLRPFGRVVSSLSHRQSFTRRSLEHLTLSRASHASRMSGAAAATAASPTRSGGAWQRRRRATTHFARSCHMGGANVARDVNAAITWGPRPAASTPLHFMLCRRQLPVAFFGDESRGRLGEVADDTMQFVQ